MLECWYIERGLLERGDTRGKGESVPARILALAHCSVPFLLSVPILLGSFSNDDGNGGYDTLNLYFTFECCNSVNVFGMPIGLKMCPGLTFTDSVQFQKKIPKISHCGSRSPKYIELGHFTLFSVLQRTAKKCTKIQNARQQPLFCLLNLLFCVVPVAVVVC